jgi:hypothetical protein
MTPAVGQARWSRREVGATAAAAVAVALGVGIVTCGTRGELPAARPTAVATLAPRVIAGGKFEASGVAHVPGSNYLLFVDNSRRREIFLMELTPGGNQKGVAVPVSLGADVTDLEGITSDGRHFYVVGSQSKKTGFEGDGLVRFTFDPTTRRADRVERIQGLKAWLAANVAELRGTERRVGDHVLNVEGLAWDPRRRRLLLGLRAPVVDGQALIVPIKLTDPSASFSGNNLRVDGAIIRLRLNGAGIRSLDYDERRNAFRLIAGAARNDENRDFRVVEWDGTRESPLRDISTFPRRLKPEGITRAALDGRPVTVIVFDTGRFIVVD